MCWSPGVTALFVALELLCCALLLLRGERWFLVGVAPLVLQECLQLALWLAILEDERFGTQRGCSSLNVQLTIAECVVVGGLVPLGFAVMGLMSIDSWTQAVTHAVALRAHIAGHGMELASSSTPQTRLTEARSTLTFGMRLVGVGRGRHERGADGERDPLTSGGQPSSEARLRRFLEQERHYWHLARLAACASLLLGLACFVLALRGGPDGAPFCTTRGVRTGHQSWPWATPPAPALLVRLCAPFDRISSWVTGWLARGHGALGGWLATHLRALQGRSWAHGCFAVACGALYFSVLGNIALYRGECARGSRHRRGRIAQGCIMSFGIGFVLVAALVYGLNEGASVWCWGASASLLTMVVEPAVAQRLEARGEMARRRPAKARSRADRAALSLWLAIRGPGRFVDANFGENGEGGSFALL